MKDEIFIYGITKDKNITLIKECDVKLKIKGASLTENFNKEMLIGFVGQHFDNGLVTYDELHDFCVSFLICDNTTHYKEIKDLLEKED